ncbi:non-ribosomal peptide synthetase [Shinella kummerowiae]|uniref:non-ribosomal peptide synthetase n=1 Tax=Shinella kummerowiae TaxID=417745 RepID=UPI0021B66594|nr:non-ribosomal peptide synthetase [Shinella kummerowiae]MCT7664364.1 amino acid adenylation domain-containing protein [Shinella kummerowiae]
MNVRETIETLLENLARQEIRVWSDAGTLRCSGPAQALTQDVTALVRDRKAEILSFLTAGQPAGDGRAIIARNNPSPPLSFAQKRLWFIEQMLPEAGLYHMPFAVEAYGALDVGALEAALEKVAARHAILRTRIETREGEPVQQTVADARIPVTLIDRRADGLDAQDLEAVIKAEARRRFDLASEPPLRLSVVSLGPDRNILLLTLHHICADGWSMDVLLKDLAFFYESAVSGRTGNIRALPIQYGDFAAWQRDFLQGPRLEQSLSFWREHLEGPLPVTRLPADFQRPPVQNNEGRLHKITIDADTVARLRGLAGAAGTTLFAALFTAFNILVYRYTDQADLVIGTPVANRNHRETEDLVGLFVNPLPVRARLRPTAGFLDNLKRVQETLWGVLDHQDLPFERLVEELRPERDPSLHPLFQLKFQLDAEPKQKIGLPGLELRRIVSRDSVAKLDLSLNLYEAGDGVKGAFEFDTALFRPETVRALATHFLALLKAIAESPDLPIAGLPLLPAEDRQRQLVEWNETQRSYDTTARFHTLFEAHAARTPDATALVYASGVDMQAQSYDTLNRRANQLAHMLRAKGVGPETVVGIALDRGFDMIAAWLGVLKAGGAYLPLDPAYPAERLAYMLADSQAPLVLTHQAMALPEEVTRINLDTGWPQDAPEDNPDNISRAEHLAYVIYTSGSTGRPKGVLVEHAGLVNLTEDKIRCGDVRPGDCVLQFFSFSFDASIPELVMSLGAGARLLLLPAMEALPGPGLAEHMRKQGVSHITMTPSALLTLPAGDYPALRMVLVGGEAPTPELIERWGSGRLFINAYGPTETTVNASMVACGNGNPVDATLWPAANKQLYVLDANMQPLPIGIPGELHIGGLGIARGYHGRPALTAERFVPDPFARKDRPGVLYRTGDRACQLPDGRIRVLGRLDDQVKIRGYRIEPGEIEAMLLTHPDIAAATVAIRDVDGEKRIVAYGVAKAAGPAAATTIRSWLAERLPRFLVPDAFAWLDRLPLTVNGKVDMSALPLPDFSQDSGGRLPQGSTEEAIAAAFRDVLGIASVSAGDDFFNLGGHSLLATRLSALARERYGLEIGVLDIFNAPTVEGLAARLENRSAGAPALDSLLRSDIRLDETIRPSATIPISDQPRNVLLTGATGFLGAYLLHELLRDGGRQVWCLVRGEAGIGRLKASLGQYGLWRSAMAGRLHAVAGDLTKPGLGLSPSDYEDLVARIDSILHNGAEVHHLHPYERLRAANVEGTTEILRLACAGRGRPLHLVSSLSALPRNGIRTPILETDRIEAFSPPAGGYNRSKWVAEHLAEEARRRGVPVTIYRPGAISGDSETGAFNGADILCRLMQGYLRSGMAPEGDTALEMLPVDYVARAIVTLSDRPETSGQIFHLVHSAPVSSALLFDACAREGLTMRRIPRPAWRGVLDRIAREETDHPLYPLMGLFEQGAVDGAKAAQSGGRTFDHRQAREALADAPFAEPVLDTALFRKYLQAFLRAGALTPSTVDGNTDA